MFDVRMDYINEKLPVNDGSLVYVHYTQRERQWGSNVITLTENTKLAYIYWNLYEYCAIPQFRSVDKEGKPGKVWKILNILASFGMVFDILIKYD